jgi:hypothetical protein
LPAIVVLTEQALSPSDASRLTALHAGTDVAFHVLVPADTERSLLSDVLDHLSLLELREALDAVRGHDDVTRTGAGQALDASLAALRAAGAKADGEVVSGDPVSALETALKTALKSAPQATPQPSSVEEVVVVTRPHAVEDTFHTDWASKARERLGVPVLHVYAGSSWLG